ncbi:putative ribonuclease H-like domain-containing protein, partial [Tanacetum coccineum]
MTTAATTAFPAADQGIFDSGCSRHMTRNKSFLTDYQEVDGGFVAFAGNPKGGKITRKGKIRTEKLDFEDVYFVKELKFNLFSVSQMCDKKNNVFFTETECLVLSPEFKLLDESQVLLKVPRQNNMYSFDLKNVVPSGGLTCLFAKATIDESNLWHRRLGHINISNPDEGTYEEFCVARTPQQNGVDERNNKTLIEVVPTQQYILLPLLYDSPQSSKDAVANDAGKMTNEEPTNEGERNGQEKEGGASNKENDQNVQDFRAELDNLLVQQKEGYANSTNKDSTVSTVGQNFTDTDDLPTDPLIPDLEDTGIFSGHMMITIIHKDHPKDQIIGDINSATQTRRMTKISKEHAMAFDLTDPSWIEAMHDELLQFRFQKVWRLVDLSKGKHAIGTKWVYRNKKVKRGIVVRNKARLVAQDPQFPDKVYKVQKALYGLHQAHRFRGGIIDKTLFIKKDKGLMHKKFQMSSIGELIFFLGLQVMQRDDGIFIIQDKYVADILKKFDFSLVKTASTPIETNKALLKDKEAEDMDVYLYRSMIGLLMYLTTSRPNIMFVVCACA